MALLSVEAVMEKLDDKRTPLLTDEELDNLFVLRRNRAVVNLLRDEEAATDDLAEGRRCISNPGGKAKRRISVGLYEILEAQEAESLLEFISKREWNLKIALSVRDMVYTYKPSCFAKLFIAGVLWLIALKFMPLSEQAIQLLFWSAATTATALPFLALEELMRARRVRRRDELARQTQLSNRRQPQYLWMRNEATRAGRGSECFAECAKHSLPS